MTIAALSKPAGILAAFALSLAALPAEEPLRIATTDMQTLFNRYYRTIEAQKKINVERAKIQLHNNERLENIRNLEEELASLRKQFRDPSISDKKKQEVFRDLQLKTQHGNELNRERQEFLERRERALNEHMVRTMRGILEEILLLVRKQAKSDDYDYVFDRSGHSTSQVPFLLHAKDAVDLTPILLQKLNKDAPEVSDPKKAPAVKRTPFVPAPSHPK